MVLNDWAHGSKLCGAGTLFIQDSEIKVTTLFVPTAIVIVIVESFPLALSIPTLTLDRWLVEWATEK